MIASGGVSTLDDVTRLAVVARQHPRLTGAIVGRAIYEKKIIIREAEAAAQGGVRKGPAEE